MIFSIFVRFLSDLFIGLSYLQCPISFKLAALVRAVLSRNRFTGSNLVKSGTTGSLLYNVPIGPI